MRRNWLPDSLAAAAPGEAVARHIHRLPALPKTYHQPCCIRDNACESVQCVEEGFMSDV